MVDVEPTDQRILFFKKHSKSCLPCQRKLRDIERSLVRFEFFVPRPKASLELRNEYETELGQLLKNVGLSTEAKTLKKRMIFVEKIQAVVSDIEAVLNNKKFMAVALVVAGVSFGVLSLLLG